MDPTKEETADTQRGKRRTARTTEATLLLLILATLGGVQHAFETLQLILLPALAYAAALRGLDAHYK